MKVLANLRNKQKNEVKIVLSLFFSERLDILKPSKQKSSSRLNKACRGSKSQVFEHFSKTPKK
jgi:hypothetical protein